MVYRGENMLVIESHTVDGCRVLLNNRDLIALQLPTIACRPTDRHGYNNGGIDEKERI
jgi:hypothetical protein